jgi:hypothetical protein
MQLILQGETRYRLKSRHFSGRNISPPNATKSFVVFVALCGVLWCLWCFVVFVVFCGVCGVLWCLWCFVVFCGVCGVCGGVPLFCI